MAGAYGDALSVEHCAYVMRVNAFDDEREHARLLARRADQLQTGNLGEGVSAVLKKLIFVGRDSLHAERADIVERCAQSDAARDIGCAGFELVGRIRVSSLLEGDHFDHVAAALVRWHSLQQRGLAIEDADARGANYLVTAESIEIGIERL